MNHGSSRAAWKVLCDVRRRAAPTSTVANQVSDLIQSADNICTTFRRVPRTLLESILLVYAAVSVGEADAAKHAGASRENPQSRVRFTPTHR